MQTAEYAGLPMELRSAAVMQQLEMFIATARMLPLTCPLSYPVLTPRAHPTGANTPVGQDQRAEDAGHGVDKDRSSSAAKHSVTTVSCNRCICSQTQHGGSACSPIHCRRLRVAVGQSDSREGCTDSFH